MPDLGSVLGLTKSFSVVTLHKLMDGFDFRQLESFCRVADLKSFSKAAESLFLTQPTISGHISALERSLGMVLLDRLGREVGMTSSGKVLYKHASALLALRRETLDEMSELSGALKGDLFIGGSNIPELRITT